MIVGISGKMNSGKDKSGLIIQYLTSSYNKMYSLEEWLNRVETCNSDPNSQFEIRKFADSLKDIICLLTNCTRKQLENEKFKNELLGEEWWHYKFSTGRPGQFKLVGYLDTTYYMSDIDRKISNERFLVKMTRRLLLQLLGTECGRRIIHPNIWCNSLMSKYIGVEQPQLAEVREKEGRLVRYPDWIVTDVRFPNEADAIKSKGGIVIRIERPSIITETPSTHESETALDSYKNFDCLLINDGTLEDLKDKLNATIFPLC